MGHLEGLGELVDLGGEAEPGRGGDQLDDGDAGARAGVEDGQREGSLDVVDENFGEFVRVGQ